MPNQQGATPSVPWAAESAAATETMLPCPSCGETEVDATFSLGTKDEVRTFNAGCMVCGMQGPDSHTPRDSADRWNALPRRVTPSAITPTSDAEISRLRAIEHMAWHFLESGAEHVEDKQLVFDLPNDDYDKLIALLPEGHPEPAESAPSERQCLRALTDGRCSYPNCMCQPSATPSASASASTTINAVSTPVPNGSAKPSELNRADSYAGVGAAPSATASPSCPDMQVQCPKCEKPVNFVYCPYCGADQETQSATAARTPTHWFCVDCDEFVRETCELCK